ncbi:SGNH/GDSL hydrolase family protein [Mesorhizobium sp. M0136]|uniref:SGNH/GDSL hydrolase family protein n=1 Tax=Mesorhizobium sp. M0136 TaxID=2956890 RepID=UPI00333A4EA5
MLVGDSLFELVPPHPLEGLNVVNAGFGGATAAHVYASVASSVVSSALKANPPSKAIIQVGTNDSKAGADSSAVAEKTMAIGKLFRDIGTEPIIFAIPPIEENKTAFRSASVAAAINDATRQASLRNGVPFIDPYLTIRGSNDVTEDGIHLARHAIIALVEAIRAA